MQRPRRMLQQTVIKVEFFHIQPYNHLLPVCRHTNIQPLSQVKTCRDVTAVLSLIPCKWKKKTWSCLKFLVPLYTEKHLAKCYKFCIFAVSYWTDFLKRNSRSDLYCIDPLVQCEYAYLTLWGATGEADNHFNSVSTVMAAIFWVLCRAASQLQFTEHLVFFFFLMNTGGSLIGRGVVGEVTLSSMLHPSFSFPMDLTFSIGMLWSTIYFLQHWQNSRALLKDIILNPLCLMGGSRVKQCHCLLPVSIRPCIFLCWLKLHSSKCLGVFYDAS